MMKLLLKHQWQQYWRSPDKGQNIFSAVLVSLLVILLAGYAAAAGFFLPEILNKTVPGQSPVLVLNKVVFYYFLISLIMRFFLQGIPAQEIDCYRMLPVKRTMLIRTLLLKSVVNVFNFVAVVFFTTFALSGVIKEYSLITSLSWLISILSIEFGLGFLIFYVHKKLFSKSGVLITVIICIGFLVFTEIKASINLHYLSLQTLGALLNYPALFIIPLMFLYGLYKANYTWLQDHFYAEDIQKKKTKLRSFSQYKSFERFGETGSYISLELKLIFRNKRPRSLFFYSLFFLLYQCFIYQQYFGKTGRSSNLFLIFFWSVFSPSFGMIVYGQNIYGWDAGYFDLICSRISNFRKYIEAKYWIMVISCCFSFLLLTPYVFIFGIKVLWLNIAGTMYSIGVNSVVMLIFGVLNKKRMELNTNMMSLQGRDSKAHFLKGLPIIILLGVIYLIVSISGYIEYLFHLLFISGIITFIFRKQFISIAVDQFEKQRYKMATGFRQS